MTEFITKEEALQLAVQAGLKNCISESMLNDPVWIAAVKDVINLAIAQKFVVVGYSNKFSLSAIRECGGGAVRLSRECELENSTPLYALKGDSK